MIARIFAVLAIAAGGCTRAPDDAASVAIAAAPSEQPTPIDPRDAFALLGDIEAARADALVADAGALQRVRTAWQGVRIRWEVGLSRALCPRDGARACVVLPFDHAKRTRPIVQGWLPRLDASPQLVAQIHDRCADKPACVLTVQATITRLTLSTEEPTSVTLGDVVLEATRPATADEAWVRRPESAIMAARQRQ